MRVRGQLNRIRQGPGMQSYVAGSPGTQTACFAHREKLNPTHVDAMAHGGLTHTLIEEFCSEDDVASAHRDQASPL
jgi:hypothetical protein